MNYKIYLSLFLNTLVMFIMLVNGAYAQKLFFSGYVVTNAGDTIKGKIPYDIGTNKNYHVVEVKDDKGYFKKFNVWQIKMYCVNQEMYFTKKCENGETEHRNKLVFMHLIENGPIKLYEYEYVRKMSSARSYEEAGLNSGSEKDYYFENKDGNLIYLPFRSYMQILKPEMGNKESCVTMLEAKEFQYKNIPELIKCCNKN